ncbi:MAG: hypothetical protein JW782_06400 [Candidatus Saganbacteria bacterium]|nr:hypothetical protein [Candidatus Saganbacteria bacterium]
MNLFIHDHMGLLIILSIPITAICALALLSLLLFLITKFCPLDSFRGGAAVAVSIVICFGLVFWAAAGLHDHFNNGKLADMFILRSDGETHLLVWTVMDDYGGAGVAELYANRLKLFDLTSGKLIRRTFLNRRAYCNDYTIYGPFPDGRAWSYSEQTGLRLLDLFEGKVLMSEKQILDRLGRLGKTIRIFDGKEYDQRTKTIYVTAPDGRVHGIKPEELGKIDRQVAWLKLYRYDKRLEMPSDLAEANVYTSLPWGNETYVFVTLKGYSLSALRIDKNTGKLLGRLDFFN